MPETVMPRLTAVSAASLITSRILSGAAIWAGNRRDLEVVGVATHHQQTRPRDGEHARLLRTKLSSECEEPSAQHGVHRRGPPDGLRGWGGVCGSIVS